MTIRIETGRLLLTELTDDDAAFILGLVNEPSFLRYIGDRGVRTLDDARRYIRQGPAACYEKYGYGLLRMGVKPGGTPIGMCGVLRRDTLSDPDLGFSMLPAWWSKGYAYEAAAAVMRHARESAGIGRVLAITNVDNDPSIRLLGKLGFRFERMVRLGDDPTELRLFVSEP
jgi:[ribosomal protein S5]-alanine N-acetyltransferase